MLTWGLPFVFFILLIVVAVVTGGSTVGTNSAAPGVPAMHAIYIVVVSMFIIGVLGCYALGMTGNL